MNTIPEELPERNSAPDPPSPDATAGDLAAAQAQLRGWMKEAFPTPLRITKPAMSLCSPAPSAVKKKPHVPVGWPARNWWVAAFGCERAEALEQSFRAASRRFVIRHVRQVDATAAEVITELKTRLETVERQLRRKGGAREA